MNVVVDSKHCKAVSKLEAVSLPPPRNCLVLVRPAAQTANKGTHTPKSLVTDSDNIWNCKEDVSADDESSEQWIHFYRGKTKITTTSANVGTACGRLLTAMNSSLW